MAGKLNDAAVHAALSGLTGWSHDAGAGTISRTLKFADFAEAFGFMTRVALIAQQADHHPDWSNSFATVTITLSTHSAGGLTQKDIELAEAIDKVAG